MTIRTRQILGLALAATLGVAIAIFEPHRHLLAVAMPLLDSFWFTYIAF